MKTSSSYAKMPLDELLKMMDDHGGSHELIHEASARIKYLQAEMNAASQTLFNLSRGDLVGDASRIAENAALRLSEAV